MSIIKSYEVVCDGVEGTKETKKCPNNNRTRGFESERTAINYASNVNYRQPFPDNPSFMVCPDCWEEYKRWGFGNNT